MNGHLRGTLLYHLLASFPLLTFAVAFLITKLTRIDRVKLPWKALTVSLVIILVVSALAYLLVPIIFDDAESGLAGASIQATRGLPVYPSLSAAARYSLLYGPLASLWHIPPYYVFGKNLISFKLPGVLVFLLSLLGLYRICRYYADPRSSLLGLGCASVLLFQYIGYDFWGRSDPLILFLIVASILVTVDGADWRVIVVAAVTVGALPNLKISAAAYLMPVLGFIVIRRGWKIAFWAVGCGVCLLALPFALPQVSLLNYLSILEVARHHGLNLDFFSRNLQYTVILLLPLFLLVRGSRRMFDPSSSPYLTYFLLIACAMGATCVMGSKVGAGNYHIFPFVAPLLHLYFWRRSEVPSLELDLAAPRFAIPFVATLLFYSTSHVLDCAHVYEKATRGAAIISEIREIENTYRGSTVGIGAGDENADLRVLYGPILAFDGQPYTLNVQSVFDTQLGGLDLPEASVRDMKNCGTAIWLIPKNQAPFKVKNGYSESDHQAFSERFRNAFASRYQKVNSLNEFDVWMCQPAKE